MHRAASTAVLACVGAAACDGTRGGAAGAAAPARSTAVIAGDAAAPKRAPKPAASDASTAGAPAASAAGDRLGELAAGPFASLDDYCAQRRAARPADDAMRCEPASAAPHAQFTPFAEVAVLVVQSDPTLSGCVAAIRTDRGWFTSAPSDDTCHEPSFIGVTGVEVTNEAAGVVGIHALVTWHTRRYDAEASYRLSTLCGMDGDQPICMPWFTSWCARNAPAGDCARAGYRVTWRITSPDGTASRRDVIFSSRASRRGSALSALLGKHRLF